LGKKPKQNAKARMFTQGLLLTYLYTCPSCLAGERVGERLYFCTDLYR